MPETYLIYCDDSGDAEASYYSAVLVPVSGWSRVLGDWLTFRKWLYSKYGVPARFEHANQWINAKGAPVVEPPEAPINTSAPLRREITEKALKTVRTMGPLRIVGCRHPGPVKAEAYQALVQAVEAVLAEDGDWGLMVVDGAPENPDPHVRQAHRDLEIHSRRILEDGWVQNAHDSQFIQMADLVAHCLYQAHAAQPAREFMWDWYSSYLHERERVCLCPPARPDKRKLPGKRERT